MFDQEISWNIKYLLKPFFQSIRIVGMNRRLYAEYDLKNVSLDNPYAQFRMVTAALTRTPQEQKHVESLCAHYGQLLYMELPDFAKLLVSNGVLPMPHSPFVWLLRKDLVNILLSEEGEMTPCYLR